MRRSLSFACLAIAISTFSVACSSKLELIQEPGFPPLVTVTRVGDQTIAAINRCPDDGMFLLADATGPEVEEFLAAMAIGLAQEMDLGDEACLDPEARQAAAEERAKHQARVDQHLAELAARCDDLFIKVDEPNVYERHTVCPGDEWASLERTHKCDEITLVGESDEPSFQCRPVIDPPVY